MEEQNQQTYDELHTENATNKEKIDQLSKTIFANEEAYKHLKSELKQKLELLDHTKAERDRTAVGFNYLLQMGNANVTLTLLLGGTGAKESRIGGTL